MKYLLLLSFMASGLILSAQQETVFGNVDVIGGFGGPFIEVGSINGQVGADVGGGGALMLDAFFLGGYGQGTSYPDAVINDIDRNIKFAHGGLWFGYVKDQYKMVHMFSSLKLGWGKVRLRSDGDPDENDRVFVLTPEIGVEVNLTDFFKLSLAGGYRVVSGVSKLQGLDNGDFSSPVGILTFRFGGFDNNWEDW